MKKKIVLFIFLFMFFLIGVNVYAVEQGGSAGGAEGGYGNQENLNWYVSPKCDGTDGSGIIEAIKITVYDKSTGDKVGSHFFLNDEKEKNYLNAKDIYVKTNNTERLSESMIDGSWTKQTNDFKYMNFDDFIEDGKTDRVDIVTFLKNYSKESFKEDFNIDENTPLNTLVLTVEPARLFRRVSNDGCYFGTYWDFAYWAKNNTDKFANHLKTPWGNLKESISISTTEITQTATPGIWEFLGNYNSFLGNVNKDISYGIAIILASDVYDDTVITNEDKPIDCPININISECGNSSIKEPEKKECLVNNSLYSFESSCNVFCSDIIETDFTEFYKTFKGNNKFDAINSGLFLKIKETPKITITKTCYQGSEVPPECSNWKDATKNKISSLYKRSELGLTVDTHPYTLFDSEPGVDVQTNETEKVVYKITYDYGMNTPIKFISIETSKDVTDIKDKYKDATIQIENDNGVIFTKRENFGTYEYNLDLNSTLLNKYLDGSEDLVRYYTTTTTKKIDNTTYITNYNYTFNNTINTSYDSNDLNYSCSYVKYNAEESCICPVNTCCDSVTCKPVECPCTCESECGCYDNIDCKPIPCPCEPGEPDCPEPCIPGEPDCPKKCDPETEICFPNLVYRPISLTNPFPGIKGFNRTPGRNWIGMARDENGKLIYYKGQAMTLKDYYITYNRGYNDYDIYKAEPLYVIKLDSNTIKAIREYNEYKKHDYNDYELECDNGKNCISKFLRGRADKFTINLIDGGTCKSITPRTFNSCITRGN